MTSILFDIHAGIVRKFNCLHRFCIFIFAGLIFIFALSRPVSAEFFGGIYGMCDKLSGGYFNIAGNPGWRPPICSCPCPCPTPSPVPTPEPDMSLPPRVILEAEEVRYEGGIAFAEGNVHATYRDIKIAAERIVYDTEKNTVSAPGAVKVCRGKDWIEGCDLKYDLNCNRAELHKAHGVSASALENAPNCKRIYFWGDYIRWEKDIFVKNGTITTSDLCPPNWTYHLTGEEIVVTQDQRIRIKNARFFLGNAQILGLRRLSLLLKSPAGRPFQSFIPRIGRNQIEGFYIKEPLVYYFGKKDYGVLHLDWYRNVGFAGGIEHYYHLGDCGRGRVNLYKMGTPRSITELYKIENRLYYKFPCNYFVSGNYVSQFYRYPGFTSPRDRNLDLYASHITDKEKAFIYYRDYRRDNTRNYGLNFTHRYYFSDCFRSDVVLDYSVSSDTVNRKYRFNTLVKLVQEGDIFDTYLLFDHKSGNQNFYVNAIPEMSVRSHAFNLGPFCANASLSAGNYHEMPSGIHSLRSDLKFSVLNKVFPLGSSGDFAFAGGLRQFVYGTGERKYLVKSYAALEERLGSFLSLLVSHYYQGTNGYSPLAMDYYDNYNVLGTTLTLQPAKYLKAEVTGGYDLNRKIYQTIIPRLEICPSDTFKLVTGATYDRNNKLWMRLDGELCAKVAKDFTFKYWGIYDFINHRTAFQNYVLEYENPDLLTRIAYRSAQRELWFDVTLKLTPYEKIDIGPDPCTPVIDKKYFNGAPDDERI